MSGAAAEMTGSAAARGTFAKVAVALGDIKLAHSVFALPFAVLGVFLAWRGPEGDGGGWARLAGQLALVVVCMVLARTWAMLINRLADHRLDAMNPRTARRAVASGKLAAGDARSMALVSGALLIVASAGFWLWFANPWPVALSVPVLGWLALYSYTKRFTALCHIVLGMALAASPLAAALAVRPEALADTPSVWWLAGMVVAWVAGFDVIYALQDFEFDLSQRLYSVPSTLGPTGAIWVSRVLHAGALAMLVMAWRSDARLGPVFGAAVVLVGGLLVLEHAVLAVRGKAGLQMAFFTINGIVSCVLGVAGVVDLVGR